MSAPLFREEQSIVAWLDRIPSTTETATERTTLQRDDDDDPQHQFQAQSKKRKHDSNHRLLSPPISLDNSENMAQTPSRTPKKRKTDAVNSDADGNERTPRPQIPTLSGSDGRSFSSASQSQHSNQSSPSRLFPQLSISPEARLERIPMDLRHPDLPRELASLIVEMQGIGGGGQGIVPIGLKPTIDRLKQESLVNGDLYSQFYDYVYGPADDLPSVKAGDGLLDNVIRTVDMAVDCDKTSQDETGWNHLVHTPLLDLVLDRLPRSLVGFVPCMNANIAARWRIPGAPGARVDYAMFINPDKDGDPGLHDAVEHLQQDTPDATVNHTPFIPLSSRPIGISLETKRQDGAGDKAVLQIGIWQASQWKLLSKRAGEAIEELSFIPGIVVEGHQWKLVATTHKGGNTILWTSQVFGNTLSPFGTFQAMAGVRRLRRWMAEVYWPWYKRCVLKQEPQAAPC
ncbi:hypothetical protein B0T10DRAFT_502817 [Thelonectria olida]|uniref:PD-(D/E)XK nuclease-like domain-containing protein n=1 Tax=Thelonectria olida TaxID=1576542 RepID=A0A9P8VMR9_9HYPO|nr:hypothetical protein B0T10DRAFT_502817 [Thelonectria olida]